MRSRTVLMAACGLCGRARLKASARFPKSFDGRNWSPEFQVSGGPAATGNNWWPAVAAGSDGTVAVAWDGYARGNYDVYLRVFRNGVWEPVQAVAASARF